MKRTLIFAWALGFGLTPGCGCKRDETLAPIDLGEDSGSYGGGDSVQAPPWRSIEPRALGNGAMLHWLEEPGAPGFHIRILIPTSTRASRLDAASVATVASALHADLALRVRALQANALLESGPGRAELVIRGRDEDGDRILQAVADSLGIDPNPRRLLAAQGKQAKMHAKPDAVAAASAVLVGELLGLPREHMHATRAEIDALTPVQLQRAHKAFVDPHQAVVIVHAGRPSEAFEAGLEALASTWKGPWLKPGKQRSALDRLRPSRPPPVEEGRVLGSPPARMHVVTSIEAKPGRPVAFVGRVIPTESPLDRSHARAVQRVLQEEFDVRLAISGPTAVLIVRVPLSRKNPVGSLTTTVDALERAASLPFRRERMLQSVELWLGARIVDASLADEDWTGLWSESLDLANADSGVPIALARDARAMLQTDPITLQAWHARWIAPRTGEPGWVVVMAGLDDAMLSALSGLGLITER